MQPAEGTYLLFIENEGVLFSEPHQKLFHLNSMASYIWYLLEEGKQKPEIQIQLETTFQLSSSKASNYLKLTEELFQSLNVLRNEQTERAPKAESSLKSPEPLDYPDDIFSTVRHYKLLSSHFRVRFSLPSHLECIDPILNHLRIEAPSQPTANIDILEDELGNIIICRDRVTQFSCNEAVRLAPLVKGLVWQTAVLSHDFFLDIHAGVVGDGENCYLFPAASGSGKSTLTAALVHHGFEYFSDEVALISGSDFHIFPAPMATCVKESGIGTLSRYYPELSDLEQHLRWDGKRVRYLPPPANSIPPPNTTRPIKAIIFPGYSQAKQTGAAPLTNLEALQMLFQECLIVNTRLDLKKVTDILKWIEATPCYRLTVSDLEESVRFVKSLSQQLM